MVTFGKVQKLFCNLQCLIFLLTYEVVSSHHSRACYCTMSANSPLLSQVTLFHMVELFSSVLLGGPHLNCSLWKGEKMLSCFHLWKPHADVWVAVCLASISTGGEAESGRYCLWICIYLLLIQKACTKWWCSFCHCKVFISRAVKSQHNLPKRAKIGFCFICLQRSCSASGSSNFFNLWWFHYGYSVHIVRLIKLADYGDEAHCHSNLHKSYPPTLAAAQLH